MGRAGIVVVVVDVRDRKLPWPRIRVSRRISGEGEERSRREKRTSADDGRVPAKTNRRSNLRARTVSRDGYNGEIPAYDNFSARTIRISYRKLE